MIISGAVAQQCACLSDVDLWHGSNIGILSYISLEDHIYCGVSRNCQAVQTSNERSISHGLENLRMDCGNREGLPVNRQGLPVRFNLA